MGASCLQEYQLLWWNSKREWGPSFRKYNTFSYKMVVGIISWNKWYFCRSEKRELESNRLIITVPTIWRRQSLNKFLKSHVVSEHVGGRKLALEGISPLSRCAVVQWWHGFFFGYISADRFIGAKLEICYRDLNVGEEICKELCI